MAERGGSQQKILTKDFHRNNKKRSLWTLDKVVALLRLLTSKWPLWLQKRFDPLVSCWLARFCFIVNPLFGARDQTWVKKISPSEQVHTEAVLLATSGSFSSYSVALGKLLAIGQIVCLLYLGVTGLFFYEHFVVIPARISAVFEIIVNNKAIMAACENDLTLKELVKRFEEAVEASRRGGVDFASNMPVHQGRVGDCVRDLGCHLRRRGITISEGEFNQSQILNSCRGFFWGSTDEWLMREKQKLEA